MGGKRLKRTDVEVLVGATVLNVSEKEETGVVLPVLGDDGGVPSDGLGLTDVPHVALSGRLYGRVVNLELVDSGFAGGDGGDSARHGGAGNDRGRDSRDGERERESGEECAGEHREWYYTDAVKRYMAGLR